MPIKLKMICCVTSVVTLLIVLNGICRAQLFNSPADPQEVERLSTILQSDASLFEKSQACKRLAFLGDKQSVPALAELLGDERMSHYARYALEEIPDAAADEALREALDRVDGPQRVGVINSIGMRRDANAVQPLGELLNGDDAQIASAAAAALGQIATAEAAHVLSKATSIARGSKLDSLLDARLRCAKRYAEQGQSTEAREIFESLLADKLPRRVRLAAALGSLRAEADATVSQRFKEYLASGDDVKFEAAIYVSRERDDPTITQMFARAIEGSEEDMQVQLLDALRERATADVVPQIAAAYENGTPRVKAAALISLGQIADGKSVPLLIVAATESNPEIAATAIDSLSQLEGEQIDTALLEQLSEAGAARQRLIATILGRRSAAAATPALFELVEASDEETRIASLEALGQTVGAENFARLLDSIPKAKTEAEERVATAAVDAACRRMPSADVVVEPVAQRMKSWPVEHRPALISVLGAVGGEEALAIVGETAINGSPSLQDAGTRELGQWMTPDAAPYLYKIAANENHRYKTRALRGYLRIARQLNLPASKRLELCRKALEIADRAEERELALEVMKRCPSPEAVELATLLFEDAELRQQAVETAVFIGEKIKETNPAAAKSAGQKALDAEPSGEFAERARELASP